jgi:hypothetical protein
LILNPHEWIEEHGPTRQFVPADVGLDYDLCLQLEARRRIILRTQAASSRALQRKWLEECSRDFRVWRDNWAYVYDEDRRLVVPAIARDYQDELQAIYLGLDGWRRPDGQLYFMAFKKSRKVGATVSLSLAIDWLWLCGESPTLQTIVGLKLRSLDDRTGNWGACTFAKLEQIIKWCPVWMRPRGWKDPTKLRFVSKLAAMVNPQNGAAIVGRSADASEKTLNSNRGSRSFRVWVDEAAAYSDLEGVFQAYNEDGVPIMTSTVSTYTSDWSRYLRGEIVDLCEKGDVGGLVVREAHYTQIPDLDPRTEKGRQAIESKKASSDKKTWAREMDMDDSVTDVGKIWEPSYKPELNELSAEQARDVMFELLADDVIWIESIDFGQGTALTSWLALGVIPKRILPTGNVPSRIFAVDYLSWFRADAGTIADDIAARGWATGRNPGGRQFTYRVCDPSGSRKGRSYENGRSRDAEESWLFNLAVEGIHTSPIGIGIYTAIDLVKRGLSEGRIALFPQVCRRCEQSPRLPSFKECVLGYSWDSKAKAEDGHVGPNSKPKKDRYANGADTLQFGVWRVWAPPAVVTQSTTTST